MLGGAFCPFGFLVHQFPVANESRLGYSGPNGKSDSLDSGTKPQVGSSARSELARIAKRIAKGTIRNRMLSRRHLPLRFAAMCFVRSIIVVFLGILYCLMLAGPIEVQFLYGAVSISGNGFLHGVLPTPTMRPANSMYSVFSVFSVVAVFSMFSVVLKTAPAELTFLGEKLGPERLVVSVFAHGSKPSS
jgi:hypothetical protein